MELSITTGDGLELSAKTETNENPDGIVVLCHGLGEDKHEFAGFYDEFASILVDNGFTAHRFDFRGHGKSEGSDLDFTPVGQVLDLHANINHLQEEYPGLPIGVVGTSFGGPPAALFAGTHSDQVDALALLCPVLSFQETYISPDPNIRDPLLTEEAERELRGKGFATHPSGFRFSARMIEEMRLLDPIDELDSVGDDVLVLHGTRDEVVPPELSENAARGSPTIGLELIEGVGHGFFAPMDEDGSDNLTRARQDEVFNRVIEWFKNRIL